MLTGRVLGPGRWRVGAAVAGAAVAAVALTACGGGGRAATSSAPIAATVPPAVRAQERALHDQVTASLHHESDARYGGLPGYLPKSKLRTDRTVIARSGHPALAIEGDAVRIVLPHGRTLATVVGPAVPDKDQGSFHNTVAVSFDATFADVHGTVPLAASAFTITDELGAVHRPRITVLGGGPRPQHARRGRPVTLVFHVTLPIGNGRVRYRPAGRHAVASWDFDSETD
jgi:hypothetical protein